MSEKTPMTIALQRAAAGWRQGSLRAGRLLLAKLVAVSVSLVLPAILLLACGGGGVGGQGTGTFGYSEGPITGFGSIVVNGVHFDESAAKVVDDEGQILNRDALKLGMTVQIDSGAIDAAALTATASTVTVASDLLGPVQASDLANSTLTVLGQTVQLTASTFYDAQLAGGQAAIAVGDLIEVYAIYDSVSGSYAARLIEPVASASAYKLRGQVQGLDTASGHFLIGSQAFAYAVGAMPAGLANGALLKLKLQTTPDSAGRWVLASAAKGSREPQEGTEVEIEAVVSAYTSLSNFTVNGLQVNAASATVSPSGATVAAGSRVEVEGTMSAGVLIASKLEVKGSGSGGDDEGEGQKFEIQGQMSALDTAAKTFVIHYQLISYAGTVSYRGGSEATLAGYTGKLEVKGSLAAGGTVVQAQEIHFER